MQVLGAWVPGTLCPTPPACGMAGDLAVGMAGGLVGVGGIQSEETMQHLNEGLSSYLERVRSREADHQKLESKM